MALSTAANIRDRAIYLIESSTPATLAGDRFRVFRDEVAANFEEWVAVNPASALRRVQVDESMDTEPPAVSNTDTDMRHVTLTVRVAYPHTSRYGANQARDRKRVIDEDWNQINYALGIYGAANFYAHHDCTPLGATPERNTGDSSDILIVSARFSFYRRTGQTPTTIEGDADLTVGSVLLAATGTVV